MIFDGPTRTRMLGSIEADRLGEWSRNSCSPPVVILEETAEPLATLDG